MAISGSQPLPPGARVAPMPTLPGSVTPAPAAPTSEDLGDSLHNPPHGQPQATTAVDSLPRYSIHGAPVGNVRATIDDQRSDASASFTHYFDGFGATETSPNVVRGAVVIEEGDFESARLEVGRVIDTRDRFGFAQFTVGLAANETQAQNRQQIDQSTDVSRLTEVRSGDQLLGSTRTPWQNVGINSFIENMGPAYDTTIVSALLTAQYINDTAALWNGPELSAEHLAYVRDRLTAGNIAFEAGAIAALNEAGLFVGAEAELRVLLNDAGEGPISFAAGVDGSWIFQSQNGSKVEITPTVEMRAKFDRFFLAAELGYDVVNGEIKYGAYAGMHL